MRKHRCGGDFMPVASTIEVTIRGVTVEVEQDELHCDSCGEIRVPLENAERAEDEAAHLVRGELGLLQPDEIRALRDRLGLTQEELENALGLGAKTAVRWETGRVMQSKATDNLLRLIDRDPTAIDFLSGAETAVIGCESWPGWIHLPVSLRGRLQQRAKEEGTDLRTLVVMILSEQLTLDGLRQSVSELRVEFEPSIGHQEAKVEPWLKDHRNVYDTAT